MTRIVLPDDLFSDLQRIEDRIARLERALRPEEIRYVGRTGQPAFKSGWTNYHVSYTLAGFYRHLGRTYLQGMIAGGSLGVAFTLPPEYVPKFDATQTQSTARLLFDTQANSTLARVDVQGNGDVVVVVGHSGWTTLDGISFPHV
jgi:hypothetical protein